MEISRSFVLIQDLLPLVKHSYNAYKVELKEEDWDRFLDVSQYYYDTIPSYVFNGTFSHEVVYHFIHLNLFNAQESLRFLNTFFRF